MLIAIGAVAVVLCLALLIAKPHPKDAGWVEPSAPIIQPIRILRDPVELVTAIQRAAAEEHRLAAHLEARAIHYDQLTSRLDR